MFDTFPLLRISPPHPWTLTLPLSRPGYRILHSKSDKLFMYSSIPHFTSHFHFHLHSSYPSIATYAHCLLDQSVLAIPCHLEGAVVLFIFTGPRLPLAIRYHPLHSSCTPSPLPCPLNFYLRAVPCCILFVSLASSPTPSRHTVKLKKQ